MGINTQADLRVCVLLGADLFARALWVPHGALRSARLPGNLIGSPINYANRLIGSPITSQSTGLTALISRRRVYDKRLDVAVVQAQFRAHCLEDGLWVQRWAQGGLCIMSYTLYSIPYALARVLGRGPRACDEDLGGTRFLPHAPRF